jgi:hypothetical protein
MSGSENPIRIYKIHFFCFYTSPVLSYLSFVPTDNLSISNIASPISCGNVCINRSGTFGRFLFSESRLSNEYDVPDT